MSTEPWAEEVTTPGAIAATVGIALPYRKYIDTWDAILREIELSLGGTGGVQSGAWKPAVAWAATYYTGRPLPMFPTGLMAEHPLDDVSYENYIKGRGLACRVVSSVAGFIHSQR